MTIDVSDLARATAFWCELLAIEPLARDGSYVWLSEVAPGVSLVLQEVPEAKTTKNRIHLDITSDSPDALIEAIERRGGQRLEEVDEAGYGLTVMADPDGNEFCVLRRTSAHLASTTSLPSWEKERR